MHRNPIAIPEIDWIELLDLTIREFPDEMCSTNPKIPLAEEADMGKVVRYTLFKTKED